MANNFKDHAKQKCWVAFKMWRLETGKIAKRPIDPNGVGAKFASIDDPTTWGTLRQAIEKCQELEERGFKFQVGLATSKVPELCFFDLDDCYQERGKLEPWAQELLAETGDTFAHRTPSGRGLRIVTLEPDAMEVHTSIDMGSGKLEVFQNTHRFVTVKPQSLPGRETITSSGTGVRDRVLNRAGRKPKVERLRIPDAEEWGEDTGAEYEPEDCVPGERSEQFASDIYKMLWRGMSPTDCVRNLTGTLVAEKYENRGDLEQEAQRLCKKFVEVNGELPYFKSKVRTDERHDQKIRLSNQPTEGKMDGQRHFLGLDDFLDPSPQNWLVDEMIPENTTGILFGPPGTFKTFYALKVGLCLSAGRQPFCVEHERPKPCDRVHMIMIAGEGQATLRLRIMALCQEELGFRPQFTIIPSQENFNDRASIDALETQLRERLGQIDPDVSVFIVVDTLSQNMTGDENGHEATEMIRNVDRLRRKLERDRHAATAMVIHHTGKDEKTYRGHSSLQGNVDWMLRMKSKGTNAVAVHRFKSKIAPTNVDVGTLRLREVTVQKHCPLEGFIDEPEDGMASTLIIESRFADTATVISQEFETDDWLQNAYRDGVRRTDLANEMSDHFSWGQRKCEKLIDAWAAREDLTIRRGRKNAVKITGQLEPD